MTARQRIENYESRLREYANYSYRGIKKICKACGPRPPASDAELKAQQMMQNDLESCCDEVRIEPFKTAPKAFMAWIRLCVVAAVISSITYFFGLYWLSVALLVVAFLSIIFEFLMYRELLDVFMRKKTSHNLIGVQKPTGELKRRIIFCGHTDSANEWRFTYYSYKWLNRPLMLVFFIALAIITMLFGLAASVVGLLGSLGVIGFVLPVWLAYVFFGLVAITAVNWFYENQKRPVEGANDNLSGCFTAMALARMLHETGHRLENTELVVLCSGSEEIGLRGAKDFVKQHGESFNDVETVFIALDTMTDFDHMGIFVRDMTNTVKHDSAVATMMRKACNTAGHDVPYLSVFLGSSDAAAATQAGMRAAAFAAMDPAPARYYHTRLDTPDALQPKSLEACLDIVTEIAHQFDETGLEPFEGSKVKVGH